MKSEKLAEQRELEVTFIVDRDFKTNATNYKSIHERLFALRLKANFNIWLAKIHAATEERSDEVSEKFYDTTEGL